MGLLNQGFPVHQQSLNGDTALHGAVEYNSFDQAHQAQRTQIIQLLVNRGADVHARNNQGNTPFLIAAGSGCCYGGKALLDLGAQIDEINNDGQNALHQAAGKGKNAFIFYVLKRRAGNRWVQLQNQQDHDNNIPQKVALNNRYTETFHLLYGTLEWAYGG